MAVFVTTVASIWFGVIAGYLGMADKLPFYRAWYAKKFFSKPILIAAVSVAFVGLYVAWISDPVMLRAFELMGVPNTGIADPNVQNASLVLTIVIAIPIAVAYRKLTGLADRIDADDKDERYFPWASFLIGIVAAVFATAAAILGLAPTPGEK